MWHAAQKDTAMLIMKNNRFTALVLIFSVLTLSGCASNCTSHCVLGFGPGNSAFNAWADYNDRRDPCQTREFSDLTGLRLKPQGYRGQPECRGGSGQAVRITAPNGQTQTYWVRSR